MNTQSPQAAPPSLSSSRRNSQLNNGNSSNTSLYSSFGLAHRVEETASNGEKFQFLRLNNGKCYRFVRVICQALMGKVKAAVECERNINGQWIPIQPYRMIAIKQLYKWCVENGYTTDGRPVKEDPLNEIAILSAISNPGHQNIMQLYDVVHDELHIYILMELLDGGELFYQVEKFGRIDEQNAKKLFYQLLQGVKYIHSKHIAHRDISLENAMLSSSPLPNTVKIIDFGLALMLDVLNSTRITGNRVGKERYMAPEVYAGVPYNPIYVDIWTLGMVLFVLLAGIYPYQVASPSKCRYFAEIASGKLIPMLQSWNLLTLASNEAWDLINRILVQEPTQRLTIEQIEAHPWLVSGAPETRK
jgi:Protein kinase domain